MSFVNRLMPRISGLLFTIYSFIINTKKMLKNKKMLGHEMPNLDEWLGVEKYFKFVEFQENAIPGYSSRDDVEFAILEEIETGISFAIPHSSVIRALKTDLETIKKDGIGVAIVYKGKEEIPAKDGKESGSYHSYEVYFGELDDEEEEPEKTEEEEATPRAKTPKSLPDSDTENSMG